MTPGARLQAAIEILDRFLASETAYAEPLLKGWARGARYAGSKDRAAVADLVYSALRRLQSARLGAATPDGRAAALGALRLESVGVDEIAALADGGPHRPDPLSEAERRRLTALPEQAAAAPLADFPAWLVPQLQAPDSAAPDLAPSDLAPGAEIAALRRRGAFDLRVNTLKSDRETAIAALAAEGIAVEPAPLSPIGLRVVEIGTGARPKLSGLAAYRDGLVEPQDAASQAAALLAAAFFEASGPGLALDVCAGGGGKTLALAAALAAPLAKGARLAAYDAAPERMADLPARLARAGAEAEILDRSGLERLAGRADLALVDAPCSGSGAWARQPDAKWRLRGARLSALRRMQQEALDLGAAALRPGGALIYVTCSLLRAENADSLEAFLARRSDFEPAPLASAWARAGIEGTARSAGLGALGPASVIFSPARWGADGFFAASLRRRAPR